VGTFLCNGGEREIHPSEKPVIRVGKGGSFVTSGTEGCGDGIWWKGDNSRRGGGKRGSLSMCEFP